MSPLHRGLSWSVLTPRGQQSRLGSTCCPPVRTGVQAEGTASAEPEAGLGWDVQEQPEGQGPQQGEHRERTSRVPCGPGCGGRTSFGVRRSRRRVCVGAGRGVAAFDGAASGCARSGLQGDRGSCGGSRGRFKKQSHSRDLRAPPPQAGIAAPHFAEVETEAWGGDMPSKAGRLGAGSMPKPALTLLTWAARPPEGPSCPEAVGVGGCAKDRGPAVLFLSGISTLEREFKSCLCHLIAV